MLGVLDWLNVDVEVVVCVKDVVDVLEARDRLANKVLVLEVLRV